jgi:hypothetical protein
MESVNSVTHQFPGYGVRGKMVIRQDSSWALLTKKHKIFSASPFGKGGERGILRISASIYDYKISPNPSLLKRGVFGE